MQEENNSEKWLRKYLSSLNLNVNRIERSNTTKRPDYFVSDGVDDFLVEIKSREKDENFRRLIESEIPNEEAQGIGYNNTISSIIIDGNEQLKEYDPNNTKWHILWCSVSDLFNSGLIARQFVYTAYGLIDIEGYYKNKSYFNTCCFYFKFNDFFRTPTLDAIVIQSNDELILCINSFMDTQSQFKQTKLFKTFESQNFVVIDPIKLEERKICFIADTNIDRNNSTKLFKYLIDKYEIHKITSSDFYLTNWPL